MSFSTQDTDSSDFDLSSLDRNQFSSRSLTESGWTILAGAFLTIALLPLIAVLTYVALQGFQRLNLQLFSELPPPPLAEGGGLANAIVGTLVMVAIATAISVPLGILAAIFLSEFGAGKFTRWIRFAMNVLNGVPSIILGVFVYGFFVLTTGTFSAVAGGVALAILMLPLIVRTADESLQLVPKEVRWASVGMGASRYQTILRVVLPAALPAITTGAMLAVARAAGETAPLIFTASYTYYWARGLFEPTASLSVLIYRFATTPYDNQQQLAWAASLILVFLVLLTSVLARWAARKSQY
jgi:phosphate transport system permease protein